MSKKRKIEVLARGVYIRDGRLLHCHSRGAENIYLPGGHVEFQESAGSALVRELMEELGIRAEVGRFLGVVEHAFLQHGKPHAEINLVFEFDVPEWTERDDPQPISREKKINFGWTKLSDLNRSAMEPAVLRRLLPEWLKTVSAVSKLGTTIEDLPE